MNALHLQLVEFHLIDNIYRKALWFQNTCKHTPCMFKYQTKTSGYYIFKTDRSTRKFPDSWKFELSISRSLVTVQWTLSYLYCYASDWNDISLQTSMVITFVYKYSVIYVSDRYSE